MEVVWSLMGFFYVNGKKYCSFPVISEFSKWPKVEIFRLQILTILLINMILLRSYKKFTFYCNIYVSVFAYISKVPIFWKFCCIFFILVWWRWSRRWCSFRKEKENISEGMYVIIFCQKIKTARYFISEETNLILKD